MSFPERMYVLVLLQPWWSHRKEIVVPVESLVVYGSVFIQKLKLICLLDDLFSFSNATLS